MSFERVFRNVFFRSAVCVVALVSFLVPAPADARPSVCDQAIVLDLGDTLRLSSLPPGDAFLRVELLEPGFLSLDVSASGASDPVVVPVRARCDGFMTPRADVLERTLSSLVLGVESPGDYVFRLTSSRPSETLSGVKVRSGHASFGEDEGELEGEPDPFGEDEGELEGEPDPFGEDEGELEGEPDPFGEDEGELEGEPDPFASGGRKSASTPSLWNEICGCGERDDHGDTFGCATALRPQSAVQGEIDNDWGDDADVFRFVLPGSVVDLWRVEVSTRGADTVGVLFDRHGKRLGRAGADLHEVLRPGVYFLRVEGRLGAGGAYRLKLDASVL